MKKHNKIWIDLLKLEENNLNINQYLILLSLYYNNKQWDPLPFVQNSEDIEHLNNEEWIMPKNNELYMRAKANKLVIDFINKRGSKNNMTDAFLLKFRNKWKGLKLGAMGDEKACKFKLIRWINNNENYSEENILKAADIYIKSLNGDYRYLQRADYFVYKITGKKNEESRLSAFIEEIDNKIIDDEWTSTLN